MYSDADSVWKDRIIMELDIPENTLIIMIKRNGKIVVPRGNTKILEGDILVFTGDKIDELLDKMELLLT
jgi:cell volume regulation protein A